MVCRIVLVFAFVVQVWAVMAADLRTVVPQQVHDPGICWDPDVEFPVPCDDDDD
jgi:hypothetical protein